MDQSLYGKEHSATVRTGELRKTGGDARVRDKPFPKRKSRLIG